MTKLVKMTVPVTPEFRNQVKASAALMGESLKDYVIRATQKQMRHINNKK